MGSFGPQLTPYGQKFKIGGYTDRNGDSFTLPLSAMMVGNFTHTDEKSAAADKVEHFSRNDNVAMQEASVFLAGRIAGNLGAFVQETYSGVDRAWAFDQADIRYAQTVAVGEKDLTLGVSLNSNPTLTDPFNTLGQWRFPYTSSDFNAGFGPSPVVENLASGVAGVNVYGLYDSSIYTEVGVYQDMASKTIEDIQGEDVGKVRNGRYGRVAWMHDRKRDNFSVGMFVFDAEVQPDREPGGVYDEYTDTGVDAAYQFLGNRKNIWTANASYVHESTKLRYSADGDNDSLDQFRVAGSYHYDQTWGATIGLFDTSGRSSALFAGDGSLNGKPDSRGFMLQADWTPWGKESSWRAPWANVRLGIQYTGYGRFMGGSSYLDADGNERNAHDNNTLSGFVWLAI